MLGDVLATQLKVTECLFTPVAESETRPGELLALLATERLPVMLPLVAGSKITLKVVFCPAARIRGKVGPLTENPAPVIAAWEIVMLVVPVLVATAGKVLLLPIVTFPKLRVAGLSVSSDVTAVGAPETPPGLNTTSTQ